MIKKSAYLLEAFCVLIALGLIITASLRGYWIGAGITAIGFILGYLYNYKHTSSKA